MTEVFAPYLAATPFINSHHPAVIAFAQKTTQHCHTDTEKAVAIYYAVRDGILYDPYHIDLNPDAISASLTLARGRGYCIEKALLMAAAARAVGIPNKLGFANVRNHLATEKFIRALRTNVFVFHGYVSLYLNGTWVKATPAFNQSLCQKFGVQPLPFNGITDAVFQEFDHHGKQYMEYLHYHGEFADFPFEQFVTELQTYYPHFFENNTPKNNHDLIDMQAEVW
ncbi:MAG TPA: transglutaminase family protein [Chitinophagales bacterium]|nr:transglutaminase family protein [Chitinophagales bacterium]